MARKIGLLILLLAIVLGVVYWRLSSKPPAPLPEQPAPQKPEVTQDEEGERLRKAAVGTWQDEYQGKRTMTLSDDGKGTMVVELSGFQATLMGPKLRFDMTWRLDGKKLVKRTIGGEPAGKVNLILNTMGDTAEDTILELTPERLLLLDKNGTTKYDWRRTAP
jgi:hypothetical protein